MESRRSQAVFHRMSCALTAMAITSGMLAHAVPSALARGGHGKPGGGAVGWADPYGYHVGAGRPGSHPAAETGGIGGQDSGNNSDGPTYCREAAAAVRIVDPLAVLPGTAVTCSRGQPAITPQDLAQQVWGAIRLPLPDVRTAPPRASAGLVGLAEWVWVPRGQWVPMSKRASAGTVWAEVNANPQRMTIAPGSGQPSMTCAGPGTAYDPHRPAAAQHTDCSYTYHQASAAQPGAAYRVTVTVMWGGSWTGSGGVGGTLPDISRSVTFSLRVGEAQGLYG